MNRNVRIKLEDTTLDIIVKLSGGNPGAMVVCQKILDKGEEIDPDGVLGGLGILLMLDTFGIYEHRIWQLYKDVCKQNIVLTIAMLRSVQLGILVEEKLQYAIDNYGKGIDVDSLYKKIKERLPKFFDELIINDPESVSMVREQ